MDRNFLNVSENVKNKINFTCLMGKESIHAEAFYNKNLFPPQYDLVQYLKFHEEEYVEEVELFNSFGLYAWKDVVKPCNSHSHEIKCLKIPRLVVVASETSSGKTRVILSLCVSSKPRQRKQMTFNLFSEVLLPPQNKLDCTLIVCLNTLVHQWVEEARKIGVENVITCTIFNQDLSSSLHNNGTHKICIMSANMLKNYTNFLTSHTFIRVVFDEVDAKNCSIQFIADSFILVSATVLEQTIFKNSLYGKIKCFYFIRNYQ
jgi:SNF2 family DNA or RNA helicase